MDAKLVLDHLNLSVKDLKERLQRFLSRYVFVRRISDEVSDEILSQINVNSALYFRIEFDSWDVFVRQEELLYRFYKKLLAMCRGVIYFSVGEEMLSSELVSDPSDFIVLVATNPYLRIDVWVPLG